jgi:hypothetical protein
MRAILSCMCEWCPAADSRFSARRTRAIPAHPDGHDAISRGNRQPSRKGSHHGSESSLAAGNDRSREALDDA